MLTEPGDLAPKQEDAARIGFDEADGGFQKRSFPASGGAQDYTSLTGEHFEGKSVQGRDVVELDADVVELEKALLVVVRHAMWSKHSCLPRRHSCRRLASLLIKARVDTSVGTART